MAELVIAPFAEPLENRVEAMLWICLEMTEDRDVARIADLFGQVRRVVDEFGPEVGVFLLLGQKTQVHAQPCFPQRIVNEARVPRLVARHQLEKLRYVFVRAAPLHLFIQHAARKLSRAGRDQEIDELFLELGLHPLPIDVIPVFILLEMPPIRVCFHLGDQGIPVIPDRADIYCIQFIKVGGVKPRRQQRVLHRRLSCHLVVIDGVLRFSDRKPLFDGGRISGVLGMHVHSLTSSEKENSQSSMNSKSPVRRVHSRSNAEAR